MSTTLSWPCLNAFLTPSFLGDSGNIKRSPFHSHLDASTLCQLAWHSFLQPQSSALEEPVGDSVARELQPAWIHALLLCVPGGGP